jgi:hypothetical protein
VAETEAIGHLSAGDQHAGGQRLLQPFGHLLLLLLGGGDEQVDVDVPGDHRCQVDQPATAAGESLEPVAEQQPEAVRYDERFAREVAAELAVVAVKLSFGAQVLEELLDEEGVAVGVGAQPRRERGRRDPAAEGGDETGDSGVVERAEGKGGTGSMADESLQGPGQRSAQGGLVAPVCRHDEDPCVLEPVGEVLEHAQGGRVRPVEVLQHDDGGPSRAST